MSLGNWCFYRKRLVSVFRFTCRASLPMSSCKKDVTVTYGKTFCFLIVIERSVAVIVQHDTDNNVLFVCRISPLVMVALPKKR